MSILPMILSLSFKTYLSCLNNLISDRPLTKKRSPNIKGRSLDFQQK
ncbi:MAG: hypothetical protein ACHBN1_31010 [Heteroscytonema crispum UTEX LB 1556]